MATVYDQYLEKSKKFNYSREKYVQLEEIMTVAKKAKLPLSNPLEIFDRFEFALSLVAAAALYESYEANGNDGRIVYLNHKDQLVNHYVNGRIKIIGN